MNSVSCVKRFWNSVALSGLKGGWGGLGSGGCHPRLNTAGPSGLFDSKFGMTWVVGMGIMRMVKYYRNWIWAGRDFIVDADMI